MAASALGGTIFVTTENDLPVTANFNLPSGTNVVVVWIQTLSNSYRGNVGSPTLGGVSPASIVAGDVGGASTHKMLVFEFAAPVSGDTTFRTTLPGYLKAFGTWQAFSSDSAGAKTSSSFASGAFTSAPDTGSVTVPSAAVAAAGVFHSYTTTALTGTAGTLAASGRLLDIGYASSNRNATGAMAWAASDGQLAAWTGLLILGVSVDSTAPTITGPGGVTTGPANPSGSSAKSIAENTSTVHTFTADESVTWSLNGGADVAFFSINSSTGALSITARNFEAPADSDANNTYIVGVRATDSSSNSTTQTVTVTVTNVNEAPTFTGTLSVPTLTQNAGMAPVATASLFADPDAGDTAAYSAIGSWPTGIVVNSSTGVISGTPTTAGTSAGLQVQRTDSGGLTVNSNTFSIAVAASGGVVFVGTVPNRTSAVDAAFTTLALDPFFSGAGTYALLAGTLPPGLLLYTGTGNIAGTPTTPGTFAGVVVRKTASSGTPAAADTNSFAFNILPAAGFDLHTAAGCVFGAISGALAGLSREVGVGYKLAVYDSTNRNLLGTESATLTTDGSGRLPRFTNAACVVGVTYDLVAKRVSDGAVAVFRLAAT